MSYRKLKKFPDKAAIQANQTTDTGNNYAAQGNIKKAMECYQQAIAIDPNCISAWTEMGNLYKRLGNKNEASRCYQKKVIILTEIARKYDEDRRLQAAFYIYEQVMQVCEDEGLMKMYQYEVALNGIDSIKQHIAKTKNIKPVRGPQNQRPLLNFPPNRQPYPSNRGFYSAQHPQNNLLPFYPHSSQKHFYKNGYIPPGYYNPNPTIPLQFPFNPNQQSTVVGIKRKRGDDDSNEKTKKRRFKPIKQEIITNLHFKEMGSEAITKYLYLLIKNICPSTQNNFNNCVAAAHATLLALFNSTPRHPSPGKPVKSNNDLMKTSYQIRKGRKRDLQVTRSEIKKLLPGLGFQNNPEVKILVPEINLLNGREKYISTHRNIVRFIPTNKTDMVKQLRDNAVSNTNYGLCGHAVGILYTIVNRNGKEEGHVIPYAVINSKVYFMHPQEQGDGGNKITEDALLRETRRFNYADELFYLQINPGYLDCKPFVINWNC